MSDRGDDEGALRQSQRPPCVVLFDQRRENHWSCADCLREGKEAGYLTEAGFDFLSNDLGVAPKPLKEAVKAAEAFPPPLRDTKLSLEHHAATADLPDAQMRLEFLGHAKREHWSPEQTRYEAQKARHQESRGANESPLESFLRHWNRLPDAVRGEAMEIIAASGAQIVDPISGEPLSQ